jgi:8-oxo-dGTP diphosphatase
MALDAERAHPLFGTPAPGRAYTGRLGAYGVACSAYGLVAAVENDSGRLYFPGGGVLPGESVTTALEREVREECGWTVAIGEQLGRAFQLIDTQDEGSFLLDARYFRLSILSADYAPAEHRVVWLPAKACAERMHRGCDRWFADHRLAAASRLITEGSDSFEQRASTS